VDWSIWRPTKKSKYGINWQYSSKLTAYPAEHIYVTGPNKSDNFSDLVAVVDNNGKGHWRGDTGKVSDSIADNSDGLNIDGGPFTYMVMVRGDPVDDNTDLDAAISSAQSYLESLQEENENWTQ
jgi:hypothetical protein